MAPAMTSHGYASTKVRTPEYAAWTSAKQRCTNPKHPRWKDYGGRGISMCAEWQADFTAFLAHIGPRPGPGYTLDRIDNDGNYQPGNVRWTDWKTQENNRRHRNQWTGRAA